MSDAFFYGSNTRRSLSTDWLMATKASTGFRKYFVKATSPGRFSCGTTLSSTAITLVCFLFPSRRREPSAGPIIGNQYLTIMMSGFIFRILRPVINQFNGFTELIKRLMRRCAGAGSLENWLLPGKRNAGYCTVNVHISTSSVCYICVAMSLLFYSLPLVDWTHTQMNTVLLAGMRFGNVHT